MRPVGSELHSIDRIRWIRWIRWSVHFCSNLRPLSKLSVRRLEFETPIEVQPSQVSMAREMDQEVRFGNEDGHGIDKVLAIRPENGYVHINFFVRIQP